MKIETLFWLNSSGLSYTSDTILIGTYPASITTNHGLPTCVVSVSGTTSFIQVVYKVTWASGSPTMQINSATVAYTKVG